MSRTVGPAVMKATILIAPPQPGRTSGKTSFAGDRPERRRQLDVFESAGQLRFEIYRGLSRTVGMRARNRSSS